MKHRIAYDEPIYAALEKEHEQNRSHRLERSAKSLGFTLVRTEPATLST